MVPQVRTADLIQHVEQDLYGAYAVVDHDAEANAALVGVDALEPADLAALPRAAGSTGLRNLLYALEWVLFGAFAGFVWWRYVRDLTTAPAEPAPSADEPEDRPVASGP